MEKKYKQIAPYEIEAHTIALLGVWFIVIQDFFFMQTLKIPFPCIVR